MASDYFNFKQFTIRQDISAFKVGTDGVLLGASVDLSGVERVLEIGTGTGLIAIMLAQRGNAEIYAIEPDDESYKQASENVSRCSWSDRIKILHSDLQNFEPGELKYDLIVTNPPYFTDSIRNNNPRRSASRHNDSLSSADILKAASDLLVTDGRLQLIMPYTEGNVFIAEAREFGFFCNSILKIKPLPTSQVRRLILTLSRIREKPVERFLTIEHGKRHDYTEEYIRLTREFYLKF